MDSAETEDNTQPFESKPTKHFFQRKAEETPTPDYFHPAEGDDITDGASVIEMADGKQVNGGYAGLKRESLQRGEIV